MIAIAAFLHHFAAAEFIVAGVIFCVTAVILTEKGHHDEGFYCVMYGLSCFVVAVFVA